MTNEKRLIDANALKVKGFADHDTGEGIVFVEDIDKAPTVEAVEVVRGRWEQGDFYDYGDVCSVCDWDSEINNCKWSYCPNCGASMMDL